MKKKIILLFIVLTGMLTLLLFNSAFASDGSSTAPSVFTIGEEGKDFKIETVFDPLEPEAKQIVTANVKVSSISAVPYEGLKNVLMIVGLYDVKNSMVNVSYISRGVPYLGSEILSAGFKLPDNVKGYTVKAFVWDGANLKLTKMIPLSGITCMVFPDDKAPCAQSIVYRSETKIEVSFNEILGKDEMPVFEVYQTGNPIDLFAGGGMVIDQNIVTLTLKRPFDKALATQFTVKYKGVKDMFGNVDAEYATISGDIPSGPSVTGLDSGNLKKIAVKFNKPMIDTTATDDTVKLYRGTTSPSDDITFSWSDDGKILYLTNIGTDFHQQEKIHLILNGLKDAQNMELPRYDNDNIIVSDATVPEVLKVEMNNYKKLTITFSEPVNVDTKGLYVMSNSTDMQLKVNGAFVYARYSNTPYNNQVAVDLNMGVPVGDNKIAIAGARDYAGLSILPKEFTVTRINDTAAPKAVSISYVDRTQIKVTFNEEIYNLGSASFQVYQAGDGTDLFAKGLCSIDAEDPKSVDLMFHYDKTLNVSATVGIDVKYKNVQDIYGNGQSDFMTISGKIPDDITKPTVDSFTVEKGNTLKVVFSEPVSALQNAGFILLNADGSTNQVAATSVLHYYDYSPDNKTFKVSFSALNSVNPTNYKLKITGIKDKSIRQNSIDDVILDFTALDTRAPRIGWAERSGTGASFKVTMAFSESLDADSATNISNYFIGTMGSQTLTALGTINGASAALSSDGKKAVLTVPNGDAAGYNYISCPTVKDRGGNIVGNFGVQISETSTNIFTPYDVSVELINCNTIKLSAMMGKYFSAVDPVGIKLLVGGVTNPALFISAARISNDQTYVTLTTSVDLSGGGTYSNGSGGVGPVSLYIDKENTGTEDQFGTPLTINAMSSICLEDRCVPTLKAIVKDSADPVSMDVRFDEDIVALFQSPDALAAAFTIKNGTVLLNPFTDYTTAYATVGGFQGIRISILKTGVNREALTIKLTNPNLIMDRIGNKGVYIPDVVGHNPLLLTVKHVDGTSGTNYSVELQFSDAMDSALAGDKSNYLIGTGAADTSLGSINGSSVSLSQDNKKATLVIPGGDVYDKIACPKLTDADGNIISNASTEAPFPTFGQEQDDTTKPTATLSVEDGNVIKVVFSEAVTAAGQTDQFVLLKMDGSIVQSADSVTDGASPADGKTFRVCFAALNSVDSTAFQLKITGVRDTSARQNVMDDTALKFVSRDTKHPEIGSAVKSSDGLSVKITLSFSETLDPDSATNLKNYFVGDTYPAISINSITGASVTLSPDGKTVTLNIPDGNAYSCISCPVVKDMSGNIVGTTPKQITSSDPKTFTQSDVSAQLISPNTIKLTARNGKYFSTVDPAGIVLQVGEVRYSGLFINMAQISGDQTYVTLYTNVNLSGDAAFLTYFVDPQKVTLYIDPMNTGTKDQFGTPLEIIAGNAISLADQCVPTELSITKDTSNQSNIIVNFDEAIQAVNDSAQVLAAAFTVKDGAIVLIPFTDYTAHIDTSNHNIVIQITKYGLVNKTLSIQLTNPNLIMDKASGTPNVGCTTIGPIDVVGINTY